MYTNRGSRDKRYGNFITNINDPFPSWNLITLTEAFAEERKLSIKEARAFIKSYPEQMDQFVLEHCESVIQLVNPDYNSVGAETRAMIDESRNKPNEILRQVRDGYSDIYLLNGKRIIFYRDKLKKVDGEYVPGEPLTTLWDDLLSNNLHNEGGVNFPKGKKPEALIKRCIELSSDLGDIVLDSFLGSGTTAAVAHKMKRRWIGIEMGKQAYTHCKPRIDDTQIEKTDTTDALIKKAADLIKAEVEQHIQHTPAHTVTPVQAQQIVETVKQKVAEDKDLGQTFKENEMPLAAWMLYQTEETHRAAVNKFIPIPRIKVTDAGVEEYVFVDFDLDMADFTHVPIKNELLVQNLEDMQDRQRIKGDAIDFEGYNPKKVILEQLRAKPEIDYEKCSKLLFKLITQVCDHYETRYGTNGMQNIIMMYKRDIGNKIYKQMLQHFYCENGFLQEEVVGTRDYNLQQSYSCAERVNLFSDDYTGNIQSVLFEGVKRGVFSAAKFDSRPELVLARVLETDTDVQNWLRPAPQEFNITYNHGHNYEPDFVVETDDTIYLVEVKGEDKISDPDVIAKKKRGIQYCEVASRWGKANGYKQWRYLFIPSKQVMPNSSFMQLAKRFGEY